MADSSFFNRDVEVQQILARIKTQPRAVMLVLGPRNCGKSALIEEVVRKLAVTDPKRRVSSVDARVTSMVVPGDLAKLLAGQPSWITDIMDFVKRNTAVAEVVAAGSTAPFAAVAAAFGKGLAGSAALTVQDVLEAYQGVLAVGQAAGKKPAVLIFDEVNVLRQVRGGTAARSGRVRQGRTGGDAMAAA